MFWYPLGCSWHENLGLKCGGTSEISFNIIRSIQHFRNIIKYKDFKRILLGCWWKLLKTQMGGKYLLPVTFAGESPCGICLCYVKQGWGAERNSKGRAQLSGCIWESSKIFTLEAKACSSCELTKDCHLAECSWEKWDPRKELCFDY